jgi:flagellar motor switch protein FliN
MTGTGNVERFAAVPMALDAELGTCDISARDLVDLRVGSVLRLSRSIGDDLPFYVGGALVGRGEIVKLEDKVALRITSVRKEPS